LATVSQRTGMDQATLSRLENGRQPNPTVDTLWRYAHAVGRQLVLTHTDPVKTPPKNTKTGNSIQRKRHLVR
jgi:transcriptional regulator with XRE-family HTH domain